MYFSYAVLSTSFDNSSTPASGVPPFPSPRFLFLEPILTVKLFVLTSLTGSSKDLFQHRHSYTAGSFCYVPVLVVGPSFSVDLFLFSTRPLLLVLGPQSLNPLCLYSILSFGYPLLERTEGTSHTTVYDFKDGGLESGSMGKGKGVREISKTNPRVTDPAVSRRSGQDGEGQTRVGSVTTG